MKCGNFKFIHIKLPFNQGSKYTKKYYGIIK